MISGNSYAAAHHACGRLLAVGAAAATTGSNHARPCPHTRSAEHDWDSLQSGTSSRGAVRSGGNAHVDTPSPFLSPPLNL
eukprot:364602-Chlamydomonas_euryale.AAC.10